MKGASLVDFLGAGFPILEAVSRSGHTPQTMSMPVAANWKLNLHISLDDYHTVAVHPTTFGRNGYVNRETISYDRFGPHSAFLNTDKAGAFEELVADCAGGSFQPKHYSIFQFLPNLIVALFRSDGEFFHCYIQQSVPIAHDRSVQRTWVYPSPFPADHPFYVRWTRLPTDPIRKRLVLHYVRRVAHEDNAACERLQEVAHQVDKAPFPLGRRGARRLVRTVLSPAHRRGGRGPAAAFRAARRLSGTRAARIGIRYKASVVSTGAPRRGGVERPSLHRKPDNSWREGLSTPRRSLPRGTEGRSGRDDE